MLQVLSESDRPIELGSVTVSDAGALAWREPKLPIVFGFRWRNMDFRGEVMHAHETVVLRLTADVAVVPFSAENTGRRQQLLSLLQTGTDAGRLSLVLSPRNTLILLREIELPSDAPLTADLLVTQTATTVLTSAPYLDLMVEYGFLKRSADRSA